MSTTSLLNLPREVLSQVVRLLHPSDLVNFGQTCQDAHAFIHPSNQLLWQDAFIHVYDDPRSSWSTPSYVPQHARPEWSWFEQLRLRSTALQAARRRWALDSDDENREQHIHTLLNIIDTAQIGPTPSELANGAIARLDDRSSKNIQLLSSAIQGSDAGLERLMFGGAKILSPSSIRQTRAMTLAARDLSRSNAARRLHTLTGLSARDLSDRQNFFRRYVYDWGTTDARSDYGPYSRDGSGQVNWTLLEAAMTCISHSFDVVVDGHLTAPHGLHYSIPYRTLSDPTTPEDWAGVSGHWLGTYSFLDYSSLLAYNVGLLNTEMGNLARSFDLRDEPEAVGDLLRMELKVDNSIRDAAVLRTNVPICEDLPKLYFSGSSRGAEYPNHPVTTVKGFAALAVGGREVKWKFVIEYHGIDQWQLEGIQPGGVRSGGIFGVWSNVEHEPNGPTGPFCYFPQELCKPTSIVLAGGNADSS